MIFKDSLDIRMIFYILSIMFSDNLAIKYNMEGKSLESINSEFGEVMKTMGPIWREHIVFFAEKIADTLQKEEVLNLFNKHSICLDISLDKKLKAGKEQVELSLEVISGLPKWLKIKNPEAFMFFCRIHGLIPIINNINIENIDIWKINSLYVVFNFFIEYIKRWKEINFALYWEINKILEELEDYWLEWYDVMHLSYLIQIIWQLRTLGARDILENFGNKLQKKKNVGVIYENIFLETAFRIENEIRDLIWFHSTYLHQATFLEDNREKTDFKWYYQRNEEKNSAKMIPIQLTAMRPNHFHRKLSDVEGFLMEHVYKDREKSKLPFLVVNTHWDFPNTIIDEDLIELYNQWIGNKEIREKQSLQSWFPFFIDTINKSNIWPAKMVIVAMHIIEDIIYKNYKFTDENKWYSGTISDMSRLIKKRLNVEKNKTIDSVKLRKLKIKVEWMEKKNLGKWKHFFYAINFGIYYNEHMAGQITIYRK